MECVIHNIMNQVGVTKEQLQERKTIDNPIEPLYWEYYCYVVGNPVLKWQSPTSILRGEFDMLCENKVVLDFAKQFGCRLEEQKNGEHWFHTKEQLLYFRRWLENEFKG